MIHHVVEQEEHRRTSVPNGKGSNMSVSKCHWFVVTGVTALFVISSFGWAEETAPGAPGPEVTLKGPMMTEAACYANPPADADKTVVLMVVEGTPEVAATVDAIMKENWPGEGSLDADHARKLNDDWVKRLKYYLSPDSTAQLKYQTGRKGERTLECRWRNPVKAVTGVVFEKDGKRWIKANKIEPAGPLKYPEKMSTPNKPFVMPGKEPLILKINDGLSLKCILVPPGKIYVSNLYGTYLRDTSWCRYDDGFPAIWTLTKPYYLAEIPVTQEMYEAVMGENPSDKKGPQVPVTRAAASNVDRFCQILSEKNHRTVRLPTVAEETNVGCMGACFTGGGGPLSGGHQGLAPDGSLLPVKSLPPNAWGFYDLYKPGAYDMTSDKPTFVRKDEVDRSYPDRSGKDRAGVAGGGGEFIKDGTWPGYFLTRFRVAVDATPEEIAEMAKAANK